LRQLHLSGLFLLSAGKWGGGGGVLGGIRRARMARNFLFSWSFCVGLYNPRSFDLKLTFGQTFFTVSYSPVYQKSRCQIAIGQKKAVSHSLTITRNTMMGT
jgi:hypothetical protein